MCRREIQIIFEDKKTAFHVDIFHFASTQVIIIRICSCLTVEL